MPSPSYPNLSASPMSGQITIRTLMLITTGLSMSLKAHICIPHFNILDGWNMQLDNPMEGIMKAVLE